MDIRSWVLAAATFAACLPAAAYDAARCAETRRNIAKLQANLTHGPTASDRQAFEQALSVYRKVEPVYCGSVGVSGTAPGADAKAAAMLDGLGSTLQSLDAVLSTDPSAYRPRRSGPALPAPAVPTGSVSGPITMQRLGGTGRLATSGASMPLQAATPSGFATDAQISTRCATAVNPSMCELALSTQRDGDPAYQQWKASEAARMDRNIGTAISNVDAAVTASQHAGARTVIPVAPPPMPYDNSDPDLAKCREGEKAPWTIAGCYDLAVGPKSQPESLADRLRRALAADRDDDKVGTPTRDEAAEARAQQAWKQRAEARLLEAMKAGRQAVPENVQARAACEDAWLYDGFGPGTCSPWSHKVVYAVDVPQLAPPAQAADAQAAGEPPFRMDPAETEEQIRRLTQPPATPSH